jgi:hypothetical protein
VSDDPKYMRFTNAGQASEYGVDVNHLIQHMAETVLCVANGNPAIFDLGFYFSFRDALDRTWTLSVLPEDGGVISDALLKEAQEGL